MEPSDEDLISAHLGGDETAFPRLLERHLSDVYNFALRLCGDEHTAQDIAQDTFVKAWKNLPKYRRAKAQFRTWLFRIAHNTVVDYLRRKKHTPFSDFDTAEGGNLLTDVLVSDEPLPDERFASAQSVEELERGLLELPERAREVLLLRYRNGLPFEEIGRLLGEPLNTVKSRHRRALIALRKVLEAHQTEPESRI